MAVDHPNQYEKKWNPASYKYSLYSIQRPGLEEKIHSSMQHEQIQDRLYYNTVDYHLTHDNVSSHSIVEHPPHSIQRS